MNVYPCTLNFPDPQTRQNFLDCIEEMEGDVIVGFGDCVEIAIGSPSTVEVDKETNTVNFKPI
jgi:hypothetical protein